jgi:hypothetical protein
MMRIAYGCACVVDCSTFNAKKLGLTSFALASSDCNVFPAVDSNAQANEPLMSSQLSRLHACSWPLDNAHSGQRCNSFSFSYIFSSPSALSILLISKAFEGPGVLVSPSDSDPGNTTPRFTRSVTTANYLPFSLATLITFVILCARPAQVQQPTP